VTLFLASRGLPFHGYGTEIGDVSNGNFLGILDLLGRNDEITRGHIGRVQRSRLKDETMKGKDRG